MPLPSPSSSATASADADTDAAARAAPDTGADARSRGRGADDGDGPRGAWRTAAACVGLPAQAVFARRAADAAPALRACAVCTVRRQCEETVAPAGSWFDGVCAGRLWRNGRAVAGVSAAPAGADAAVGPAPGLASRPGPTSPSARASAVFTGRNTRV